MSTLTHKTTILLSPEEHHLLLDYSRKTQKTMGGLIREALRKLYFRSSKQKTPANWEKLFRAKAPVPDWETMEEEILKGRLDKK